MKQLKQFLTSILGFVVEIITGNFVNAERHFVDLLSAIVPYLVPIIPAYLTYQHTYKDMGFELWIALTAGVVTECLGIVSISTAIDFYEHNRHYRDVKNKAPLGAAIFAYVFYLVIVILVNTVMELITHSRGGWTIFAISVLSLLSVPSGLLVASRRMHYHIIEGIHSKSHPTPNNSPLPVPGGGAHTKHASDYHDQILNMLDVEYSKSHQILTPKQITSRLRLEHAHNKGYVSTLTAQWRKTKGF